MSNQISGTVEAVLDREEFASGFCKQVLVVRTDEKYPQSVPLEFVKDKIDLLDKVRTRDRVTVDYNVRGSEYKGRYYVNLQAWRIDIEGGSQRASEASGDIEEDVPQGDGKSDGELEGCPF